MKKSNNGINIENMHYTVPPGSEDKAAGAADGGGGAKRTNTDQNKKSSKNANIEAVLKNIAKTQKATQIKTFKYQTTVVDLLDRQLKLQNEALRVRKKHVLEILTSLKNLKNTTSTSSNDSDRKFERSMNKSSMEVNRNMQASFGGITQSFKSMEELELYIFNLSNKKRELEQKQAEQNNENTLKRIGRHSDDALKTTGNVVKKSSVDAMSKLGHFMSARDNQFLAFLSASFEAVGSGYKNLKSALSFIGRGFGLVKKPNQDRAVDPLLIEINEHLKHLTIQYQFLEELAKSNEEVSGTLDDIGKQMSTDLEQNIMEIVNLLTIGVDKFATEPTLRDIAKNVEAICYILSSSGQHGTADSTVNAAEMKSGSNYHSDPEEAMKDFTEANKKAWDDMQDSFKQSDQTIETTTELNEKNNKAAKKKNKNIKLGNKLLKTFTGTLKIFEGVVELATIAVTAFSVVIGVLSLILDPFVLMIIAIVAIVALAIAAIIAYWDDAKKWYDDMINSVKNGFNDMVDWLVDFFSDLGDKIKAPFVAILNWFDEKIEELKSSSIYKFIAGSDDKKKDPTIDPNDPNSGKSNDETASSLADFNENLTSFFEWIKSSVVVPVTDKDGNIITTTNTNVNNNINNTYTGGNGNNGTVNTVMYYPYALKFMPHGSR